MPRPQSKAAGNSASQNQAAHQRMLRKNDLTQRKLCNVLEFWRMCMMPRCRRNQTCQGEGQQCFERHWQPLPEDVKDEIRNDIRTAARMARERQSGAMTPAGKPL